MHQAHHGTAAPCFEPATLFPSSLGDLVEFGNSIPAGTTWSRYGCGRGCTFKVPVRARVVALSHALESSYKFTISCPKCGVIAYVSRKRTIRIVEVHA